MFDHTGRNPKQVKDLARWIDGKKTPELDGVTVTGADLIRFVLENRKCEDCGHDFGEDEQCWKQIALETGGFAYLRLCPDCYSIDGFDQLPGNGN